MMLVALTPTPWLIQDRKEQDVFVKHERPAMAIFFFQKL